MITGIIQARLGSSRLPGKVLLPLTENHSLLWHIINRLENSKLIDKLVIATTEDSGDDKLVDWAKKNAIDIFRGSTDNVLKRFHNTASASNADIIVRITADDPFKDPEIIDSVIKLLVEKNLDFACNNNPPTFPEGLDTEVFTMTALRMAYENATDPFELEHVTQYFYRNPSIFRQANYKSVVNHSNYRWTVDTENDFIFARNIYRELYKDGNVFKYKDILELLESNPELARINSNEKRSDMYKKL